MRTFGTKNLKIFYSGLSSSIVSLLFNRTMFYNVGKLSEKDFLGLSISRKLLKSTSFFAIGFDSLWRFGSNSLFLTEEILLNSMSFSFSSSTNETSLFLSMHRGLAYGFPFCPFQINKHSTIFDSSRSG